MTEEEIKRFIREEVRKQLADIVRQIQAVSGIRRETHPDMEYKGATNEQ